LSGGDKDSRIIQGVATWLNLMLEAGNSRPQQSHGAGDVRRSHGCAACCPIAIIAVIGSRSRICSRSSDIWLDPVTAIGCNWPTTAKASDRIGAGIQRPYRVGSLIKRRWIYHGRTSAAGVTRRDYHLDTGCALRFHGGLQSVHRTTLRGRAAPRVVGNIGRFGRVALIRSATQWVRRKKPFHALDVPGWCPVSLVHVTATDPLCAGRHADLIGTAVIANRGCDGVRSVEEIVARLR
jgi:hypothetical protein